MNNDRDVIVEVLNGQPDERGGTFKNDKGEDVQYHTRKQEARLESGGFIYPYDVRLERDQPPYKPGRYRMAVERMLQINKGAHSLAKFPKLEPLAAVVK